MNNGKYINKTLADFVMERDSIAQDILPPRFSQNLTYMILIRFQLRFLSLLLKLKFG